MRVRYSGDTKLYNAEKVLDTLSAVAPNTLSTLGPILVCNQGYGNRYTVKMFSRYNSKVLVIANSMCSEHSIVGTFTVKEYIQKIHHKHTLRTQTVGDSEDDSIGEVLETDISACQHFIGPYTISNNLTTLFGPENAVAPMVIVLFLTKRWLKNYCVSFCMASKEYTK
jgi:hypothetical protein